MPDTLHKLSKAALLLVFICCYSVTTNAHSDSRSIFSLQQSSENTFKVAAEVDILDLVQVLTLDSNRDAVITWQEVQQNYANISTYIKEHLKFSISGTECTTTTERKISGMRKRDQRNYLVTAFVLNCSNKLMPSVPGAIDLEFSLFKSINPLHRGLLEVQGADSSVQIIRQGKNHFMLSGVHSAQLLINFGREGVRHIFSGYDHLAFLLLLLLPLSTLKGSQQKCLKVASIVTAFTLAHSITLTLASTGKVSLPSNIVELAIATSVVVAALINLVKPTSDKGWIIAFAFGLIHGFGFAGALAEMTNNQGAQLLGLLGFNLGVELGQLLVVALVFPFFILMVQKKSMQTLFVPVSSFVIALFGGFLMLERMQFIWA